MKRWLLLLLAVIGLPAAAQSYPTKPVQVVLAFTPGSALTVGSSDAGKLGAWTPLPLSFVKAVFPVTTTSAFL